jgi:hypothetical protein
VPIAQGQRRTAINLPENYGLPAMLIRLGADEQLPHQQPTCLLHPRFSAAVWSARNADALASVEGAHMGSRGPGRCLLLRPLLPARL